MADVLTGLRVLDLTSGIAGPVAALLLAEAGADVIRIEPPGGDDAQDTPAYAVWNRSKRRLALDLETDRPRFDRLLAGADVLLLDLTPAEARSRNLDPDELARAYPTLVVCSITGFPAGHRLEDTPVRDTLVLAQLGLLDEQLGRHRDGPIHLRFPLGSWCAAYLAATGTMARIVKRGRTGRGGVVRTSLAQGAIVPMAMHWYRAEAPSASLARGMPKGMAPGLFECGDGVWIHIMRCPDETPLMKRELAALSPAEMLALNSEAAVTPTYPHFGANIAIFKKHPSHVWLDEFWRHDIPAQPALDMGEVYRDPECVKNGYVVEVVDPRFGRTLQPGSPIHIQPPMRVRSPLGKLEKEADWLGADSRPSIQPRTRTEAESELPLAGVKVVDFGSHLAGPFAPMLMADLGADVIKVEPPKGETMRPLAEGAFIGCQRNKRGLALELKQPAAAEIVRRLVGQADIVHHNMRMPAALKLGLDYATLNAIRPDLVYCHVSTYGPEGVRKDWPGMDQMAQAMTGWEKAGAGEGNPPHWHRFGFMDHLAAMASLFATLLALYRRDLTGEGQAVAASLLGAGVLSAGEVIEAEGVLTPLETLNGEQTGVSPEHGIYECADGWVAVAALTREEAARFRQLVGADQPGSFFTRLTCSEALAKLEAAGVPCAPVRMNQREAFLSDPESLKTRMATVFENTRYGRLEHVGAFWSLSDADIVLARMAPAIGEHTAEILAEIGVALGPDIEGVAGGAGAARSGQAVA